MNSWIKCTERLPELIEGFSNTLLLYGKESENEPENYFIGYMIGGNRFYASYGECCEVTHWQPLPEPPKDK